MQGITLILEDDSEVNIPVPRGVNGYLILAALRDRKSGNEVMGLTQTESSFLLDVEDRLLAAVNRMEAKKKEAQDLKDS